MTARVQGWGGQQQCWSPPNVGLMARITTFPVSGLYAPSPGLISLQVECWGAGGGGGGAQPGAVMPTMGGGGGGSGGYSRRMLQFADVLGGVVVTVGFGGGGGTVQGAPGGPGGATSFGALVLANGGHGGTTAFSTSSIASSGYGGAPAAVGLGDVAFAGNAGVTGGYALPSEEVEVVAGEGGPAPGGGGVANVAATLGGTSVVVNGPAGLSPGAGGGGGASASQTTNATGGVGANGFCVVTEYIFAGGGPGEGSVPCPCPSEPGWCGEAG